MSRAVVTSELAELIKTTRIENNIYAKDLAKHIHKSAAFISRLERGSVTTIGTKDLYSILLFLYGNESNFDSILEQIYRSLRIKHTKKEIERFLWYYNFDTVFRQIPIPESLIDDLNSQISENAISFDYLLSRINSNEWVPEDIAKDTSYPYNLWFHVGGDEASDYIKIKMNGNHLFQLLNKEVDKAAYIDLQCIAAYTIKISQFGERVFLTEEESNRVLSDATSLLSQHKFYMISEKQELLSLKKASAVNKDLLTDIDLENLDIINDVVGMFHFFSAYDIQTANDRLRDFSNNMQWDLGFMMRIISMSFSKLDDLSVENKHQLINKIDKLIDEYSSLPDERKVIESY